MEVFNIKFVGEVEKHSELYDYTLREYTRKDCTEKAWNEVAKQVNLSAAECKEKWRNLRSTFAKNLKPKPSGSGSTKKKPYYLTEVMQFAIPFIKVAGTPTGNLPEISQRSPVSSVVPDDPNIDDPDETLVSEHLDSQPQTLSNDQEDHPPPSLPTPRPLSIPTHPGPSSTSSTPQSQGGLRSQSSRRRKRCTATVQNEADKAFAEYFALKKQKISSASTGNLKVEGIKNFLDSLIPDLLQMNDVQLRTYKRRALLLIDEVLQTLPENRPSTSASQPSYQSSVINIDHFSQVSTDHSETQFSPEDSLVFHNF